MNKKIRKYDYHNIQFGNMDIAIMSSALFLLQIEYHKKCEKNLENDHEKHKIKLTHLFRFLFHKISVHFLKRKTFYKFNLVTISYLGSTFICSGQ